MACKDPNCVACRMRRKIDLDVMNTKVNDDNIEDLALDLAHVIADHRNHFNTTNLEISIAMKTVLSAHIEYATQQLLIDNIDIVITDILQRNARRGQPAAEA